LLGWQSLRSACCWIKANAKTESGHGHDIVPPNKQGDMTDAVGGAGGLITRQLISPSTPMDIPWRSMLMARHASLRAGSVGKSWPHGWWHRRLPSCNMTGGQRRWLFIKMNANGTSTATTNHQPHKRGPNVSTSYEDTWSHSTKNKARTAKNVLCW